MLKTRTAIQSGESIATPLRESNVFPPMVVRMIDVGERTGALESMLSKIADFYEDQVDTAVAGLTSMIEPILMVFLGWSSAASSLPCSCRCSRCSSSSARNPETTSQSAQAGAFLRSGLTVLVSGRGGAARRPDKQGTGTGRRRNS